MNLANSLQLSNAIEKHNIIWENIYNFNEKGFLIGLGTKIKRILPREAL